MRRSGTHQRQGPSGKSLLVGAVVILFSLLVLDDEVSGFVLLYVPAVCCLIVGPKQLINTVTPKEPFLFLS